MSETATVSVIMPAYNASPFVGEALDSVFAQTFSDFEVIVINDGSPDTEAFEKAIQPYRDRIVYLKQENRGPSAARNLAIRQARGEFVAFLDSDDSWLPEYLAEQIDLFKQRASPDLVCSDMRTYGDPSVYPTTLTRAYSPRGIVTLKNLLMFDFVLLPSSTVARKRVLIEVGLFDEAIVRRADWDLWMRIAHRGGIIAYQGKVLGRRRIHSGALSRAVAESWEGEIRVLSKLQGSLQLAEDIRSLLEGRLAQVQAYLDLEDGKRLLLAGHGDRAKVSLGKAHTFFSRANLQQTAMSTGPVSGGQLRTLLRGAKLRGVLWGLQRAPRLTTFAAKTWEQFLLESRRQTR